MPQLLLELFSEEIPARMQAQAARDLARMAAERFKAQDLAHGRLETFVTPRRLTLVVDGLPPAQADRSEERKGPRANAPEAALAGFLRSTGLGREQLVERDGVLYAHIARQGRPTSEIAAEVVSDICAAFPWPKSMRSGVSSFRWVRPLRSMILLFDGQVVPCEVGGISAGAATRGHRFMGGLKGDPFDVADFDDYRAELAAQFVTLDATERRAVILERGQALCAAEGLELVPDDGLADEVAGLVEHPAPLLGRMDETFLDLPPEVIRTSMRTHQKYFAVRDPSTGRLAPRFVMVANIEASDGGEEIRAGNAKVLSARLSDARFFWDEDAKPAAFGTWAEKLKGVTFHAKLGTMAERVERIAALAREIAPAVGADPDEAETAGRLAKLDLASAMVGEFPELQGVMGGYYVRRAPLPLDGGRAGDGGAPADADGEARKAPPASDDKPRALIPSPGLSPIEGERRERIADAVRDHYKPVGPSDSVPTAPVTVALALADKLDTLVSFFAIDERPTGSRDPYALRRAALGVIRLILERRVRLPLREVLKRSVRPEWTAGPAVLVSGDRRWPLTSVNELSILVPLLAFFADRLKVQLRDEGRRHDLVDAVFALGDDDLVRIVDRVEALSGFLSSEDGANLLAGYRRAVNILKAEEKKTGAAFAPFPFDGGAPAEGAGDPREAPPEATPARPASTPSPDLSPIEGERRLHAALVQAAAELEPALANEDFASAMASLSQLRGPVDAFFEHVLVNDPDPQVRLNRLRLLSTLRDLANRVADFSLIQG